MDLKKLMTGANPQNIMLEQTRGLKGKWEKTGLLEGVGSETTKHGMAVMLENQAKQLLDEATRTGTSAGSEEWAGVALPLVRRIFGSIAAKEFVSVQPMNLPSGLIFYMDFKYGSNPAGTPDWSGSAGKQSLYGKGGTAGKDSLAPAGNKLGSTQDTAEGLYGAGRFGYTINNETTSSTYAISSATAVTAAQYNYDGAWSASLTSAQTDVRKLTVNLPLGADLQGIRAFEFTPSSGSAVYTLWPQFTKYNNDATSTYGGTADIVYSVISGQGSGNLTLSTAYHKQPTAENRGDFEDKGSNLAIPEIELELKSEPIVAKTRKLKAIWTPELAQDLNAYHSIDAEAELTQMLSEYISLEIDLEILEMLQQNALTVDYWSTRVGVEWNGSSFANIDNTSANAYVKPTWFQTLGIKLQKVSNRIHQLTMRGGANFLVASPNVCTILESMNGFTANPAKDALQFAAGVSQVGSISNRYDVYKNPYMTENVILMGFKGSNFFETGAVYAPYVPLIMTPLVYDPTNFTPRRGVMTRYAKKIVRPEFYGKILIEGMNSL